MEREHGYPINIVPSATHHAHIALRTCLSDCGSDRDGRDNGNILGSGQGPPTNRQGADHDHRRPPAYHRQTEALYRSAWHRTHSDRGPGEWEPLLSAAGERV